MVNNVSMYNNGQYSAAMSTSNLKSEEAKTDGFERALNEAAENGEKEKIMEAAREFEGYFLQMMLKELRNTIPKDGLIPKNNAEEIFQGMLDEEYSKNAAKGAGIGLAKMIYDQMTRNNIFDVSEVASIQLPIKEMADEAIEAAEAAEANKDTNVSGVK